MPRPLVIGLDIGTTGCKAVALDSAGRVIDATHGTYPLQTPQPGWAQQDVHQIDRAVSKALRTLMNRLGQANLQALAFSGAMHSLMAAEPSGRPLSAAMTWADNRAAGIAAELHRQVDATDLYRHTGCPLTTNYHVARLRWWLARHRGFVPHRTLFVGIKDWLLHRLTGIWAMDFSLASATGLFDLHRLEWYVPALAAAHVKADHLPPLVAPESVAGAVTPSAARRTGLPAGLPVIAGASDGALANLGSGAVRAGQTIVTIGTSGAVRRIVEEPRLDGPARGAVKGDNCPRTWCYVLTNARYFCGGAINNGGLAVQWVCEHFFEGSYEALMQAAETIEPGAGGLLALPYFTGERSPYWSADARAALLGMNLSHSKAHLARAILEGVAFCIADVWDAVQQVDPCPATSARLTGGITRSPLWAQILADVLGIALHPIEAADASAIGAAMLGHAAIGSAASMEAIALHLPSPGPPIRPRPNRHGQYQSIRRQYVAAARKVLFDPEGRFEAPAPARVPGTRPDNR